LIYRKTLQKPKEQDFFFSWLVQRRLAKPIVYALKNSPITPNQVSIISILVGFVGVYYLFIGRYQTDLLGILILHFAAILDCVDGDLARTRGINSKLVGKFADYIKVIILDPLIPIGIGIGLVNNGYSLWWFISIVIVSFWKIAPQFAREHVVVRSLSNSKIDSINKELFLDPQQKMRKKQRSLIGWIIFLIKSIIGLPNALLNTVLILSILGYFIPEQSYYWIKEVLLLMIIVSYFGFFMIALIGEVKSLKK